MYYVIRHFSLNQKVVIGPSTIYLKSFIKLFGSALDLVCFCVEGESVEENAYVVLRLLIRRPECFGPALRGDGGDGLLATMEEAIRISADSKRDGRTAAYESNRTLYVRDGY